MTDKTVSGTSDERIINNSMRQQYRVLSENEKLLISAIKEGGEALLLLLHAAGGTEPSGERMGSRELSIAQTNLEQAVMWAVKHITR